LGQDEVWSNRVGIGAVASIMPVMELLGAGTEAQEYFVSVEELFGRLRRRPLILAPRDVGLVQAWYEAGVPLRVVHKAIERFFAREERRSQPRRRGPSLEYCEADVFELWELWRESHRGVHDAAEPGGDRQREVLSDHLAAVRSRLVRARDGRADLASTGRALGRAIKAIDELADSLEEASIEALEEALVEIERRILRAIRRDLRDDELARLQSDASQHVDTVRKGIDERAYQTLLRKTEERALLAHVDLPRIALYAF